MEREPESSMVVRLGERPEPLTKLGFALSLAAALGCVVLLLLGTWPNGYVLVLGLGAAVHGWSTARQLFTRETIAFSDQEMKLTFDGAFGHEERVFALSEVSTLKIVRRRTRRAVAGEVVSRYFQFWHQGQPEQARRALSVHETWQLERVLDELEERERDADAPPREDPLVCRGGVNPHVLRRLRR